MKVEVQCDEVKPDVDAATRNGEEAGLSTTKQSATRSGSSGDARLDGAASPTGSEDSDIICEDEAFAPVAFPAFSIPSNAAIIRREVGGSPVSRKEVLDSE